ncbi:EamA-like transporter family protein [Reichenbachiella faecimaris]|uniref:EamA-like transporter family protein n=1 Tax=Reichenbachiella faecimaris TaxID=692418 RepID=A0A1W2G7H8_REIFA|nr:EamA family transporter [Reichenbachiella faecimaris]SMD32583.1 EamA-like transporter family protein [Reichenbachiella faecimaris]
MNKNLWLFIIPALIWGSTWFTIKFQLGIVDPLVSVVYRYLLAGTLMLSFCFLTKKKMSFSFRDHGFMALQGFLLFGVNYWLVYEAEVYLASGLIAVAYSTLVFLNSGFGAIFLKRPINKSILMAALFGLSGTILIFSNEFLGLTFSQETIVGTTITVLSVVIASLGNITSARNSANNIPVIQANAYGMLYGGIWMGLLALILDRPFSFDPSTSYIISLLYLTVFGSIIAFGTYLTLISRVGADKAAYALVIIPVIAIGISSIFESYQMTLYAALGVVLILIGNVLAIRQKKKEPAL